MRYLLVVASCCAYYAASNPLPISELSTDPTLFPVVGIPEAPSQVGATAAPLGSPLAIAAVGLDPAQYAPTGYVNVESYPDAKLYPAKLEEKPSEYLPWSQIKLPQLLPIHGVRVKNRMPQLAVFFDAAAIKAAGGTTIQWETTATAINPDDLAFKKYKQMYEPTAFHAIETGVMASVPSNCFMTFPEKGLKVYSVTYADGTTKTLAALPMLGPYGNEKRFSCFPPNLEQAWAFGGKFTDMANPGIPDHAGYLQSFKPGGSGYINWDDDTVQNFVDHAVNRDNSVGNYVDGHKRLYNVFDKPEFSPKGKECLVVGSAPNPWVEGILLSYGAAHVTTSEYQVPRMTSEKYKHKMTTIHHEELLANPKLFDMIVIFSSIEHDGLGRYHDPMSPGGDLQQCRNLHSLLKPGGLLIVEFPQPSSAYPDDTVDMNQHRIYGPLRYPKITSEFALEGLYLASGENIASGTDPIKGGYDKVQSITNKQDRVKKMGLDEANAVSVLRRK